MAALAMTIQDRARRYPGPCGLRRGSRAMPPRGHATARQLINARDIGELARRIARAEEGDAL